ncbi:MAG: hypothetical protein HQL09_04675 [Nitrospirae bacterium]|nr:hypothetical protein [Nitrospirota bacterium]
MEKKDNKESMRVFNLRRDRELLAIAVTLCLLLFLALLHRRPDLLGTFSKNSIVGAQIMSLSAFIGFSVFNWRCPSCNKYLGPDINRRICNKCGTRLR